MTSQSAGKERFTGHEESTKEERAKNKYRLIVTNMINQKVPMFQACGYAFTYVIKSPRVTLVMNRFLHLLNRFLNAIKPFGA